MSQPQGSLGVPLPALARLPRLSPSLWIAAGALAVAAALLPGLWTLPGFAVLLVCLLIVLKPEVAVYLLTLSVPLGSMLEIEASNFSITPTEGLTGLLVIGWVTRSLARRRFVVPFTPLSLPLAAMLAIVAFSGYQAAVPALTLKETLKWLELVLVYLFIVAEMGTAQQALTLLLLLLAGAGIESLLGSVQFALGIGPDFFAIGRFMRAYGTFEQPNPYAGYLGMLIPMAVGLLLTRPAPRVRYYTLALGLLASAAVGMSLSRGAWIGIALGIFLMMLFWSRRSRILLAAGVLATTPLAALAFLNLLPNEISSRLATALDYFRFTDVTQEAVTSQNWAVIERVAHWQAALDMIARHPLFGVGAGNYPAVYEWYALPGWVDPLGHAHNYYLNIAAETGIPGLLIYLSVLLVALFSVVKWLVQSGDLTLQRPSLTGKGGRLVSPPHVGEGLASGRRVFWRGILVGVLGALVASSMHNMFDNLFVHSMSVQLGMILALAQLSANGLFKARPQ